MAWNEFLELLDEPVSPESDEAALKAVATWYHAFFTGLILQITLIAGQKIAGDCSFQVFTAGVSLGRIEIDN